MTNQNDPAIAAEIEAAPLVLANDGIGFLNAWDKIVPHAVETIIETDGAFNALVLTHRPEVYRGVVTGIVTENREPYLRIVDAKNQARLVRVYDILTLAVL